MLEPAASVFEIALRPMVSVQSLLRVAEILVLIAEGRDRVLREAVSANSSAHDSARTANHASSRAAIDGPGKHQEGRPLGNGKIVAAPSRKAKASDSQGGCR